MKEAKKTTHIKIVLLHVNIACSSFMQAYTYSTDPSSEWRKIGKYRISRLCYMYFFRVYLCCELPDKISPIAVGGSA